MIFQGEWKILILWIIETVVQTSQENENTTFNLSKKLVNQRFLFWDLFMTCADYPDQADRIIGGENARNGEFPWQAMLAYKSTNAPFCGGTLLLEKIVITAAHCIALKTPERVLIVLGNHNLYQTDLGEVTHEVRKWVIHPSYDTDDSNDIAIIELKGAVNFNKYVDTACLPMIEYPADKTVLISGWGSTAQRNVSSKTSPSTILQKALVKIVNRKECQKMYDVPNQNGYTAKINKRMICAASEGKDACQGDSGGPLVGKSWSRGKAKLLGITSWGFGCADKNYPGVYTNVADFKIWIIKTISDLSKS